MKRIQYALVIGGLALFFSASGITAVESLGSGSGKEDIRPPRDPNKEPLTQEEFDRRNKADKERKFQKLRESMKSVNRPIEFYGIVVDQDKKPVVGAKIRASTRLMKDVVVDVGYGFEKYEAMTDGQGRFSFKGMKGDLLSVKEIIKDGHLPSKQDSAKGYWYNEVPERIYKPNSQKPEIFRMWKQAGAEKIVHRLDVGINLGNSLEFKTFNLLTGKEDPEGDLRIRVYSTPRVPLKYKSRGAGDHPQKFRRETLSWTAEIEAVDGGIQEMEHEEIYLAPAAGYKPKWSFHQPVAREEGEPWVPLKAVDLFVHCRGKYYGRLKVKLFMGADHEQPHGSGASVTYFMNPWGSRNLEYDPMLMVKDREWGRKIWELQKELEAEKQKRRQEQKKGTKK